MVNDFLFEIGSEELPSAMVKTLSEALVSEVARVLDEARLSYAAIEGFGTPRRLAVCVKALDDAQQGRLETRRGPAKKAAFDEQGRPTKALLGFMAASGATLETLSELTTDKGSWMVYEAFEQGARTEEVLPQLMAQAVARLPIPKPMRWGSGEVEFARPVHWIVMRYGEKTVHGTVLGVQSGNITYGHRFHHPEGLTITTPDRYATLLKAQGNVIAEFAARRSRIVEQIKAIATAQNAIAVMPDALLDEVTSIVEWPYALHVPFSSDFLKVPSEALIASMQAHQKCFALKNTQGELLPGFITVSNLESLHPQHVIAGNEKVMRARLSDAAFFFELDKKKPLSAYEKATQQVVFQTQLGSLYDKASRMQALMEALSTPFHFDAQEGMRAAMLSKCDLLTGMVGEFPELQGVMGYYYALASNESPAVSKALEEQYLPRFAGDDLPQSAVGRALSLSDRLDTLLGIFAIGQKPTGVKDPFKLRRHALAVVRMLIQSPETLSLEGLIARAAATYGTQLNITDACCEEVKRFILDRLHSYYQSQGVRQDVILAVRARQEDILFDFDKRLWALQAFILRPEIVVLGSACKRVNNLLQHAHSSGAEHTLVCDESALVVDEEKALFQQLSHAEQTIAPWAQAGDYEAMLHHLVTLREPIDAFFDHVMVMVDDKALQWNRLALLARMANLLQSVADMSHLQSA